MVEITLGSMDFAASSLWLAAPFSRFRPMSVPKTPYSVPGLAVVPIWLWVSARLV